MLRTCTAPHRLRRGVVAPIERTTQVRVDKGLTQALDELGLNASTVGRAKLTRGSLVFPITRGNVAVFEPGQVSPSVIGQIQHEGSGLWLAAGAKTVRITNLDVDPGTSRVYGDVSVNNKTVATRAYVFTPDGRTLEPLDTSRKNRAAAPPNQTLNTKAVKPGLLVGIATITVKVPAAS